MDSGHGRVRRLASHNRTRSCPTRGGVFGQSRTAPGISRVSGTPNLEENSMNTLNKLLLACIPFIGLAACSGGDTQDRLDLADPAVRFVHAAQLAPAVTLYRGESAQSNVTNVRYPFASNYFDVSTENSSWTLKNTATLAVLGTVELNPSRGNKYTFVAVPDAAAGASMVMFSDPYNKSLSSEKARVRVLNASPAAASIDVYLSAPGTDISAASVTPTISATTYKNVGPASGNDSVEVSAGTYRTTVTLAGTKTVLLTGQLVLANNKDVLMITVPNPQSVGATKALVKVEGTAGVTELPAN